MAASSHLRAHYPNLATSTLQRHFLTAAASDSFAAFSGNGSAWHYFCLQLTAQNPRDWLDKTLGNLQGKTRQGLPTEPPFRHGLLGYIDYETARHQDWHNLALWRTESHLAWHEPSKTLHLLGDDPTLRQIFEDVGDPTHHLPTPAPQADALTLLAEESDLSYQSKVAQVIADIRSGRYYQLNLLRYFGVATNPRPESLRERFIDFAGPFGFWLKSPDTEIVSFSPERLAKVSLTNHSDAQLMACAQPIKGTTANHPNPAIARQYAQELLNSPKDLAELHMIVDLLRNDLQRISLPQSVKVIAANQLRAFKTVQHLEATITSALIPTTTWQQFMTALCPGGSITGAPKIEVMAAITELEQRPRGPFMGSAFIWDPTQSYWDSSIMIRSLWRQDHIWQYAAGSGLVIHSDPIKETNEIATKCRILTTPRSHGKQRPRGSDHRQLLPPT